MSTAYYIVLDNDSPGFDILTNGKAIAQAIDVLDALCIQGNINKLDSFLVHSLDDLHDFLEADVHISGDEEDHGTWFEPEEGIVLIDKLTEIICKNPQALNSHAEVLEDLAEYKQILTKAKTIGAKWHLALDM